MSATTPQAIVAAAAECVSRTGTVWSSLAKTWRAANNLPFDSNAELRVETFNIKVRDDLDTQSFGLTGSYQGQFRMVVQLGTPVHNHDNARMLALRNDVKRIAHSVEAYAGYPAGTHAVFYESTSGTAEDATPQWWETEVVFRVIFLGLLEAPPEPPPP